MLNLDPNCPHNSPVWQPHLGLNYTTRLCPAGGASSCVGSRRPFNKPRYFCIFSIYISGDTPTHTHTCNCLPRFVCADWDSPRQRTISFNCQRGQHPRLNGGRQRERAAAKGRGGEQGRGGEGRCERLRLSLDVLFARLLLRLLSAI